MNKLVTYILLFAILIASTSCSKDEIIDNSSIQGTWKLTSFTLKTPVDLNNDGIFESTFTPGCLNGSDLKFTDSSNGTLFFSASVSYTTTNEDGTIVFMTACSTNGDRIPSPITYTKDEETIILNGNDQTYILTLDGNKISMLVSNGFDASDADTLETTVSQDITYIYTKQY